MKPPAITIRISIFINKPKEEVWEFTQDYENRTRWDKSILEASVVQTTPRRIIRLKTRGNSTMTFIYKLDDRPHKTTLAMKEIKSSFIESGGGSWTYEQHNNGTLWTQSNSLVFKKGFLVRLFLPLARLILINRTRKAMLKAKKLIEQVKV